MTTASYPIGPNPDPLKGTLLDTADVADGIRFWGNSGGTHTEELFDSYNCMKFDRATDFCAPAAKTFDLMASWQSGFRFAVYGGAHCKAVGLDQAHMKAEVGRVFAAGESTAVERAFMATRFAAGPDTDPGAGTTLAWAAPSDVHSAGAVKPLVGVSLLEGYAASVYVGVPTIHVPRTIAGLLTANGTLEWDGNVLRTKMGTKVAAGAGYDYPNTSPTGAAAAADEKWIYVTGEVLIRRSEPIIKQMFSQSDNEVFVLGERAYVGAADCFTAAVRVQVTT